MHRLHIDDIRDMMVIDKKRDGRAHFEYLRQWLEKHRAFIVRADDVTIPNTFMPGTFTSRPGKWGEDEPYPPFGGYRKLYEDARNNPPRPK
jgi:hypothetical protein